MNKPLSPAVFSLTVLPLLAASMVVVILTMQDEPETTKYPVVITLCYLLGSVPWGYLLLRWRRGVDIREYGSGRTGMSNVLRTAGGRVALVVLILDMAKGILAVALARAVIGTVPAEVTASLLVLVGHNWPVFLQFRGGRGIATGLGGLSIMAPLAAGIACGVFLLITWLSKYISVGSITSVVVACLSLLALSLAGIYSSTYLLYGFLGSAIIIWQHRDNIQRIRQGTERRLGQPASKL